MRRAGLAILCLGILAPLGALPSQAQDLTGLAASAPKQWAGAIEDWSVSFKAGHAQAGTDIVRFYSYGGLNAAYTPPRCDFLAPFVENNVASVENTGGYVDCPIPAGRAIAAGDDVRMTFRGLKGLPYAASFNLRLEQRSPAEAYGGATTTKALTPHPFEGTPTVGLSQTTAGAESDYEFTFSTHNVWPKNGQFAVTFPPGTTFNVGASSTVEFIEGGEGSFSIPTIAGTTLVAQRAAESDLSHATFKIRVSHIGNRPSAGPLGLLHVVTRTATPRDIDFGDPVGPGLAAAPTGAGSSAPPSTRTVTSRATTTLSDGSEIAGDSDAPTLGEETATDAIDESSPAPTGAPWWLVSVGAGVLVVAGAGVVLLTRRPPKP